MANTILHKRSSTSNSVPTSSQLTLGELALNTTDGRIYMKTPTGVVEVSYRDSRVRNAISTSGTGITYDSATGVLSSSATSANTASAVVSRDSSGNFSAGTITAALSGNASTATALQNARTINGTSFDGTANVTVTAASNTLTGTTLASNVTGSSLTSVGTLGNLTVTNTITGSVSGNAGTATRLATARTINGVSFDGSSNITITTAAVGEGSGNLYYTDTRVKDYLSGGTFNGNIIPATDNVYSLGSATKMWKDVYVGPGSLYVNGQKVLEESSGNIVVSADANQNLVLATTGDGNVEIDPQGTGSILLKGPVQIQAGSQLLSSDGNAIQIGNQVAVDSITSKSSNTDLTLTAAGTGKVLVNDSLTVANNLIVSGNLTINGTTTTINATTLSIADNIVDLNSNVTGAPTTNAGIRIVRGDEAATQLRWNETTDAWQYTADGSAYFDIVGATATQTLTNKTIAANSNTISGLTNANFNGTAGITNANLANSTVTVGSTAINLGATATSLAGLTSVTASTFTGNLVGNVTGTITGGITGNAATVTNGVYTTDTGTVTNAMLAGSIADTKLSTISTAGKVSNSATTAASANTASAIVARDASGNFTASTITAALTGNVTGNTTGTHTGAVVGNASTATTLATARTIALTGDATASGSFDGSANYSQALTLATVNSNVGAFGSATAIPVITVNAKGLVTAVSTTAVSIPSGALTFTGDVTGTGTTGSSTALSISAGAVTNSMLAGSIALSKLAGLGTGVATALAVNTGSAGSFAVVGAAGGTPSSLTLTNATGLPISTGVSGLATGVATFLGTPSSANLAAAITDETGSGSLVFGTSPTLTTPTINAATIGGHLVPSTDLTYDLGDATHRFRNLYLSGSTIAISGSTSGTLTLAASAVSGTTTVTFPATTGTVITTGDSGTVTSTMIADGTIVNGDINASAAIAYSKLALTGSVVNADIGASAAIAYSKLALTGAILNADLAGSIADSKLSTISTAGKVSNSATTATNANTASAIVARDASGNFTAGTITAALTGNVTGNLTGAVTGNASTATALQTARTINGVSFDGTGNVTVTTAGTGVSVVGTAISIGQAIGTSDSPTFNNLTLNGNLTVSGTTTTINSTTLDVADLNITVAKNASSAAAANGAGLTVAGPTTQATFTYTSADDRWNLNKNLNVTTVYGALSGNATTATTLQTARTINGVSFDGSANISFSTSAVSEGTNLYYTDARARAALSGSTGISYNSTTGAISASAVPNSALANSAVTVTAGTGLSGGGSVSLGGTVTLTNAGVTSNVAGTGISVSGATGAVTITNTGVTSIVAGTGISVSGATGAVTVTNSITNNNQLSNGAGYITGITSGNVTTALGYTPYNNTNPNGYITSSASISGNAATATQTVTTVTGTNSADLVYGNMADNDQFRIRVGGTASNAGWAELATADDGTEPIYVRQYTGVFTTVARTATLLDGSGNTSFPGSLTTGGEITAYYSDVNLKTNIQPIANALSKIEAIRGVTFDPNQTALDLGVDNTHQMGVIAQEVEAVAPELVVPSAYEGYKTVKYDKLTALLIEAVKELSAEVKNLKAQLNK